MNFSMKSIPIVILLLACVNCVAADFHISGSFIGGILGFVSHSYLNETIII